MTRDFDFVIEHPGDRLARAIGLFYDRGLELVSRLNAFGDVTRRSPLGKSPPSGCARFARQRLLLQCADGPSRRLAVRLPHSCSGTRPQRDPNQDSHACLRRRLRTGPVAAQADRQSSANGAGRCRRYCLSRISSEKIRLKDYGAQMIRALAVLSFALVVMSSVAVAQPPQGPGPTCRRGRLRRTPTSTMPPPSRRRAPVTSWTCTCRQRALAQPCPW